MLFLQSLDRVRSGHVLQLLNFIMSTIFVRGRRGVRAVSKEFLLGRAAEARERRELREASFGLFISHFAQFIIPQACIFQAWRLL